MKTLLSKKKGQMFMFIIVAIIIIAIIILVSIIVSNSKSSETEAKAEQQMAKQTSTSIPDEAQHCADLAAQRAVFLAGKQGGYLFKSQGGLTPEDYSFNGYQIVDLNVPITGDKDNFGKAYWILANPQDIPPEYPRFNSYGIFFFPYISHKLIISQYKGITIQDNMQQFFLNEFNKCFNLSHLEEKNKGKVSLEGNPSVKVSFNARDVTFKFYYPLSVYGKQRTYLLSKVNVPFLQMYSDAVCFVNNDINNLSFDVNSAVSKCNLPNDIQIKVAAKSKGYSAIRVAYLSKKYLYDGQEYTLDFLRQNRPPVLFNLTNTNCIYVNGNGPYNASNLQVNVSDEINFTKCAMDPDEDVYLIKVKDSSGKEVDNNKNELIIPSDANSGAYEYLIIAEDYPSSNEDYQKIKITVN